jgi:hypothetical protein
MWEGAQMTRQTRVAERADISNCLTIIIILCSLSDVPDIVVSSLIQTHARVRPNVSLGSFASLWLRWAYPHSVLPNRIIFRRPFGAWELVMLETHRGLGAVASGPLNQTKPIPRARGHCQRYFHAACAAMQQTAPPSPGWLAACIEHLCGS